MKDLETLCRKVSELTWNNDHTGAKLAIANHFGLMQFAGIFKAIEEIHEIEGSMSSELAAYRKRKGE